MAPVGDEIDHPAGRIDLSAMLTHTFGLSEWRDAFYTIADQASGASAAPFLMTWDRVR